MNKILFMLFGILANYATAQTKTAKLQDLVEAYAGLHKLNGAVLVTQNGEVLLSRGYGFSNIKDSIQNGPGTIFQIGSLTKQFTATAILRLEEMGLLSTNDKLSKYFPDFPNGDSISLEHLLTHTSGIFNYTDDMAFMQNRAIKPVTRDEMLNMLKEKPLAFQPGTNWAYSNSNYLLLGYVICKVANKPYEQVMRAFVFDPLGMCSTGFDFAGLKSEAKATGYKTISGNSADEAINFDSTVSYAAGAMYSTAEDLYKWQKGLLDNEIIAKASLKKATTPYRNRYGYGIYVDSIYGKKIVAHGGLTFGFTSYMAELPEDDVSIIILNNIVSTSINDIAKDILAILYDRPYNLPEEKREIALSTEVLRGYIGNYELAPQFFLAITSDSGLLYVQATGHAKVRLYAEKEDILFVKDADIRLEFKRDKFGDVTEVELIEDGTTITGNRLR